MRIKINNILDKFLMIIIALILLLVFSFFTKDILRFSNIMNILVESSIIAIAGAGMTMAITAGGFDLAVGSILALTTCIMGKLVPLYGVLSAAMIALGVSIFCGILNGLIITKIKIQTFVTTLATAIIIEGIALIYTKGEFLSLFRFEEAKVFSARQILGIGVPVPILLMVLIYALVYIIYKFTRFGVFTRAIGSNEYAARLSGVPVDWVNIGIFGLTALTASISGLITTSQLLTGGAVYGSTFPLEVITITILGGTSLKGGKGYVWGTLMAAIMITVIENGLNLLGFSDDVQKFIIGLILLIALSVGGIRSILLEKKSLDISNGG